MSEAVRTRWAFFHAYVPDEKVKLYGVEAGGTGLDGNNHAAPLASGAPAGVLHGMHTYLMQDEYGQVQNTSSVAAGLDYPAVGPEHAWLCDCGRVEYVAASDEQALAAFADCSRLEGILPALESAHALAYARKLGTKLDKDAVVLVNLSGRGDKDLDTVLAWQEAEDD